MIKYKEIKILSIYISYDRLLGSIVLLIYNEYKALHKIKVCFIFPYSLRF